MDKFPIEFSCGNVTLHSLSVKSVIPPGTCNDGFAISAFVAFGAFGANGDTVTFGTRFLALHQRTKHQNAIKSASEFFDIGTAPLASSS